MHHLNMSKAGLFFVFLLSDNILHLCSNFQPRTSRCFQSRNIFSLAEIQEGGEVEGKTGLPWFLWDTEKPGFWLARRTDIHIFNS